MYQSQFFGAYGSLLQHAAAALFAIVMTAASMATLAAPAISPLTA